MIQNSEKNQVVSITGVRKYSSQEVSSNCLCILYDKDKVITVGDGSTDVCMYVF
jgi:hypothetical protein